jgi:hypothetical protein
MNNRTITIKGKEIEINPGTDLSGLDLSGQNFSGWDLSGCNLTGCNMTKCNLNETNLDNAIMIRADLRNAKLASTQFNGADLRYANMSGLSGLDTCSMQGADLREAILEKTLFYTPRKSAGISDFGYDFDADFDNSKSKAIILNKDIGKFSYDQIEQGQGVNIDITGSMISKLMELRKGVLDTKSLFGLLGNDIVKILITKNLIDIETYCKKHFTTSKNFIKQSMITLEGIVNDKYWNDKADKGLWKTVPGGIKTMREILDGRGSDFQKWQKIIEEASREPGKFSSRDKKTQALYNAIINGKLDTFKVTEGPKPEQDQAKVSKMKK